MILEPSSSVFRTKGRFTEFTNKRKTDAHNRSIHRDSSGFEYVEEEFHATQKTQSSTENIRSAKRRQGGGRRRQQEKEGEISQTLNGEGVMSIFKF